LSITVLKKKKTHTKKAKSHCEKKRPHKAAIQANWSKETGPQASQNGGPAANLRAQIKKVRPRKGKKGNDPPTALVVT